MRLFAKVLIPAFAAWSLLAEGRINLAGRVVDSEGHPIDRATVLVYRAGVKHGYSTFCPSCYVDCGKRTVTGSDGTFTFKGVDPGLWFDVLVVRDGFGPAFLKKVDPVNDSNPSARLLPRAAGQNPTTVVRGRVVDDQGVPLRDVVVQPLGISSKEYPDGSPSSSEVSQYGTIESVEPIAVTNAKGEFEIASLKPILAMLLKVEARGFAPKLQALTAGTDRGTVVVQRGAVVRGRVVNGGTPVAGAEIGLIARSHGGFGSNLTILGDPFDEIRVGTQKDGSFVLADVPTPVDWYVYAKMESLPKGRASRPAECVTKRAGEVVNVENLQLERGHRLSGKVVLSDGASMPDGMRVMITSSTSSDSQVVPLRSDGTFESTELATGTYDVSPAVRGYRASEEIQKMPVSRDIANLTITVEPESRQK